MATQLEIFRFVAPQFALVSDANVQIALDLAKLFINVSAYPVESQDLALALKAASILFVQAQSTSGETGGTQMLKSEREGDLMRTYDTSGKAATSINIYDEQLALLGFGTFGAPIITRYGLDIPQEVDLDSYRQGPWFT